VGELPFKESHPLPEVSIAFKNPCEVGVLDFGVKLLALKKNSRNFSFLPLILTGSLILVALNRV
jgi:hypothetical protein